MQWAKDHHGKSVAKQLEFLRGSDATVSEALLLLGPWLVLNLIPWLTVGRATKVRVTSDRTAAIDGARVIATAAVVLLHLNTGTVMNDPSLNKRRLIWFYTQRFVDIFGVLSILVTKSESEGLLGSLDALGRKLSRQLPLIIIMMRVRMWAAGLCLSHESCREMNASGWSANLLVGWLTFRPRTIDGQWYFSMDLKIWLVFKGVYMLNQRFPREVVIVSMAVLCFCMAVAQPSFDGNRYLKIDENLYYKFWAYRLPMSLLVYAVSLRSNQLRRWASRHPWLWSSTAAALCSLGWLGCWPQVPAEEEPGLPWRPLCAEDGLVFFWGGVFFHVGVTMLCLQPPWMPIPGITWMVRLLSPLTLGILTLHPGMFNLLKRCQHAASPWFLLITNNLYKHHWDDFPRGRGLVVWTAGVLVVVVAAQVLLWTVQQPWENLWSRCPKLVRRVLVLAYFILFVKECWQNSSESLGPK